MSHKLIEALNAITEADFDALALKLKDAEAEVQSLKELLKVVAAKLGKTAPGQHGGRRVQKPKSAAAPNVAADGESDEDTTPAIPGMTRTEQHRRTVQRFIQANGPTRSAELCKKTGVPVGSITAVLKHPMFVETAIGWGLTVNHR